jgi:hypothetical protein
MLIAFTIFALLNYTTLVLAPYFNCSIQKLSISACILLLVKYGCELAYYTKILTIIFELGALFADIIGTGLFYLSIIRVMQILIDRHELKDRAGLCFGGAIGLYVLSILLGYAIGFLFFEETPAWIFVICLTSLTMIAGAIAYFTFVEPQQSQNANPPTVDNNANQ